MALFYVTALYQLTHDPMTSALHLFLQHTHTHMAATSQVCCTFWHISKDLTDQRREASVGGGSFSFLFSYV